MTPEIKKKLEEMARKWAKEYQRPPFACGYEHGYLYGAQAAWDLAVKYERERLNESFFLKIIERWKFLWMDVQGTDERDRKNYFSRAFGVDANMQYSLARMLEKEIITPPPSDEGSHA